MHRSVTSWGSLGFLVAVLDFELMRTSKGKPMRLQPWVNAGPAVTGEHGHPCIPLALLQTAEEGRVPKEP